METPKAKPRPKKAAGTAEGKAAPGKHTTTKKKPRTPAKARPEPPKTAPRAKAKPAAKQAVKKPVPRKVVKANPAAKTASKAPQAKEQQPGPLNLKQQRFVDEYLVDLNGTQAAIRAGYSPKTANEQAAQLLAKLSIKESIAKARAAQQERTQITADRWLKEVALIALADARDLVDVQKACCRNCHGEGHRYQRTIAEMNADREAWSEKGKNPAEFDEAGGIGFNPLLSPHPECPHCGGAGHARTTLKDTRFLSPAAAALYAGAKETQYGIEIKMHSKLDALEKLAKHLGMYEKDNTQKTDPLSALLTRLATGNGNGFSPVPVDPERKQTGLPLSATEPEEDD